jgi:hypothetical protein
MVMPRFAIQSFRATMLEIEPVEGVESAHPNKVTFPASSEAIDALTGGTSKALVNPLVATAPSITRHLMLYLFRIWNQTARRASVCI